MFQSDWFIIKNLSEFVEASRRLVFNSFGSKLKDDSELEQLLTDLSDEEKKELDQILPYKEAWAITRPMLKKQTNKKTNDIRYVLNEEMYMSIITALNDRLVSNILNSLVNKGLIETAYDEKSDDFIFWVKNNENS